ARTRHEAPDRIANFSPDGLIGHRAGTRQGHLAAPVTRTFADLDDDAVGTGFRSGFYADIRKTGALIAEGNLSLHLRQIIRERAGGMGGEMIIHLPRQGAQDLIFGERFVALEEKGVLAP